MSKIFLLSIFFLQSAFTCHAPLQFSSPKDAPAPVQPVSLRVAGNTKIQVALLLDTSNSMDGLIDQAKSQLWKMVNKLASAKKQDGNTELEIALFEYGNSGLNAEKGYIKMHQSFNADLDGLSERLFALKTNGGDEFCGWVIQSALDSLKWSNDQNDLKAIVIAGNEPFSQGRVDFRQSCENAAQKGVIINTIFCGNIDEGRKTQWQEGALIAKGKYLNIDTGKKIVHRETPFDKDIIDLNNRLNKTYIGYGSHGKEKKERQSKQDSNAAEYGAANVAQRAAAKSKSAYKNDDWDIVDAAQSDKELVKKLKKEDLPEEFKDKSTPEIEKEIEKLRTQRESIKTELAGLEKKMQQYITAEMKKSSSTDETLDNALIQTIAEQAKAKGLMFED